MAERIRVLLVDDHAMFREGVRSLLEGEPDLEVVGEVEDGRQAVQTALTLAPDVVLMDITMPQLDGIEATRQIRSQNDAIKVLILTMHDNEDVFFRSISAGASGYVLKRSGGVELMSAIRSTHEGHSYLSPLLAKALMSDYLQRGERGQDGTAQGRRLSGREQEILKLIAEGHSSREIAEMLDLSVKTVHNHRTRLMTKLDIHRNTDLVKYAIRLGMVQVD
ncbi:MAG TPA: response regulator transcription factor [Candidatus Dormibacteraeota bacterium]|jgi:two-component system response regulator NreC|nr:response regulator transcription factor [Chloroflexota bacterium]MEA2616251.1 two-component system, NarL family, response regulator NreC [Chloroflexota bacterium]HEV7466342.1 response regulator transcription factor [Candidatus Dormibacteraeota bacterium]